MATLTDTASQASVPAAPTYAESASTRPDGMTRLLATALRWMIRAAPLQPWALVRRPERSSSGVRHGAAWLGRRWVVPLRLWALARRPGRSSSGVRRGAAWLERQQALLR